ncbi:hypothetical protein GF325_14590 [Candidatus Bathyarchaeota archaeon]|nr:hypothetical protein [Candidatus Bathyarchaeota archaeon]
MQGKGDYFESIIYCYTCISCHVKIFELPSRILTMEQSTQPEIDSQAQSSKKLGNKRPVILIGGMASIAGGILSLLLAFFVKPALRTIVCWFRCNEIEYYGVYSSEFFIFIQVLSIIGAIVTITGGLFSIFVNQRMGFEITLAGAIGSANPISIAGAILLGMHSREEWPLGEGHPLARFMEKMKIPRLILWGSSCAMFLVFIIPTVNFILDLLGHDTVQELYTEYVDEYSFLPGLLAAVISIIAAIAFLTYGVQIIRTFKPYFFAPLARRKKRKNVKPVNGPVYIFAALGITAMVLGLSFMITPDTSLWYTQNPYEQYTEKQPYLSWTDDPSRSMTITWETKNASDGYVKYGTTMSFEMGTITAMNDSRQTPGNIAWTHTYSANITGLSPSTLYYYQVGGFDAIYTFRTAPEAVGHHSDLDPAPGFRFTAYSDTQHTGSQYWGPEADKSKHVEILELMYSRQQGNFDFILSAGDIVQQGGDRTQWARFFREINTRDIASTRPYMASVGNHDHYDNTRPTHGEVNEDGITVSHEYLSYAWTGNPANPQSDPGNEFNHWFNYSNCLFIFLDTKADGSLTAGEAIWFNNTLNQHADHYDWVFLVYHHPVYSSAQGGGAINSDLEAKIWNVSFWTNGTRRVDFILNGHRHSYERLEKDGITQLVIAGSSTNLDGYGNPFDGWTQRFSGNAWHYTAWEVQGRKITFEAIDINGYVFDSKTFSK